MSRSRLGLPTLAVVLASTLAAAWTLTRVPPGAMIPMHFGIDGRPDGFRPAVQGLFVMPLVGLLLWVLQLAAPLVTPRGGNLERSRGAYNLIWLSTALLLGLAQALIIAGALGQKPDVGLIMPVAVGALLTVIGNVMPKLRWNYVVGIRTPWTLADERVWDQTHRFGGRAMVAAGLTVFAAGLFAPRPWAPQVLLASVAAAGVSSAVWSYVVWMRLGRPGETR